MKSSNQVKEIADEYIFKKCTVSNHQSELMKQSFIDGYTKAMHEYFKLIKELTDYGDEKRAEIEELENENKKLFSGIEQVKEMMIPGSFDILKCGQILERLLYPSASAKTDA